jgi:hypothetical protein
MSEERIAKITSTFLGVEDHGIFTTTLHVDYGGSGQGIGGYSLDEPRHDADGIFVGRRGTAYGMEFIRRTIAACGVDSWEKVAGRTILVVSEPGWHGRVLGIKPLPTERGKPFMFADLHGFREARP